MRECFCERSKRKQLAMMIATRGSDSIVIRRDAIMGLFIADDNGNVKKYCKTCPLCGKKE